MGMTMTATPESDWLTITNAAKQLEVHSRTLRRYIRQDRLKVVRLSQQVVRVRPEDIDAFLDQNVKMITGPGVCYVPRPVEAPAPVPEPKSKPKAEPDESQDQDSLPLG